MPSLVFAGRRWALGTDDIPLVIFFPALFHGAWSIFLVVSWSVLDAPKDCHGSAVYTVIIAGLFFTFLFTFLVQSWLFVEGLKGVATSGSYAVPSWLLNPGISDKSYMQAQYLKRIAAEEFHGCFGPMQS